MHTTAILDPAQQKFYDTMVRRIAESQLPLRMYGSSGRLVGTSARFYKLGNKPLVKTGLVEGVTPVAGSMSLSWLDAALTQLGYYEIWSDIFEQTADPSLMVENAAAMGDQAARSVNWHIFQELATSTNVYRVNSRASTALVQATDYLALADIKKVNTLANRTSAPGFASLGGRRLCLIHPDVENDLTNDTKWKGDKDFQQNELWGSAHVGDFANCSFVVSNELPVAEGAGAAGADVYTSFVLSAGAFGTLDLQDIRMIVKALGSSGVGDALDQRGSSGWKTAWASQLIFDELCFKIESSASMA